MILGNFTRLCKKHYISSACLFLWQALEPKRLVLNGFNRFVLVVRVAPGTSKLKKYVRSRVFFIILSSIFVYLLVNLLERHISKCINL